MLVVAAYAAVVIGVLTQEKTANCSEIASPTEMGTFLVMAVTQLALGGGILLLARRLVYLLTKDGFESKPRLRVLLLCPNRHYPRRHPRL